MTTYHALKDQLRSLNRPSGLLPNTATDAERDAAYQALIDFYPVGTLVQGDYFDSRGPQTFTGEVTGHFPGNIEEPSFHLRDERGFTILLRGSLLTALPNVTVPATLITSFLDLAQSADAAADVAYNNLDNADGYVDPSIRYQAAAEAVANVLRFLAGTEQPNGLVAYAMAGGDLEVAVKIEQDAPTV